uniref:BY PROTMAP: gi/472584551/gb/EMS22137.1/ STE/STE11/cdc15 protein kinase [Rhodosporidium toruloides NP11] gi/647399342/emb/CDR43947.1/ RHTO0S08e08328g1_1 [Rhodosporidium toruloides] n=1 Tax=Rhodotorula toruloides TaxID=5286 RepID=A0A0K3CJ22_RHOTO
MADPRPPPSLPDFKLAEKLGQGAFGSVYKIDLSHIPESELPDIMSEIDLLKNLHHPNIVQYRGYARTSTSLYIILEYCENGSLSAIIKKFGRIPESLVGLYTLQVLQGLQYLHDQGVIHRDIKGSNILATKEGSIKLADFGVATRVGGPIDSAVVGSPYWMAPEVVDQTGATPASDIWSLGALVVELITGKPPYHFLDPMPALFRIVNDDCPPLPEGASAVVRDFLGQCFQKDANLRVGARKLLRHPWMVAAKRQADQQRKVSEAREAVVRGAEAQGVRRAPGARARPTTVYEEEVQKVQEWNEALKAAPTALRAARSSAPATSNDENRRPTHLRTLSQVVRRPSAELASALSSAPAPLPELSDPPLASTSRRNSIPLSVIQPVSAARAVEAQAREEQLDDNWDSDFEDGISISKIAALEGSSSSSASESEGEGGKKGVQDEDEEVEGGGSVTIRPGRLNAATIRAGGSGGTKKAGQAMPPIVEDYSDLVGDDEADALDLGVSRFKAKNKPAIRLLRPSDIANFAVPAPSTPPSPRKPSTPTQPGFRSSTPSASGSSIFDEYGEQDVDDYSDLFGRTVGGDSQTSLGSLKLNTRLSNKSWLGEEDSDEEDPFAAVEAEELDPHGAIAFLDNSEADLAANLARDHLARQCALVEELVDVVASTEHPDDFETREAALQLTGLLEESCDACAHFVKSHGMLVVLEALRIARSRDVLSILLRIVNLIVGSDPGVLEKIALVGGCPVVMAFSSKRYSREIRLEAALFIGAMCRTSLLTLQMFVSCQGLRSLVEMLDENYQEGKDLVWMAVDGISRVFEMQGPIPRNDFCRILTQEAVLEPLSNALLSVCGDTDDLAESAKAKIVHILLLFAQSDHKVKEAIAKRGILLRLVRAADLLEPDLLAVLLKTVKNVSMLPSALEVLQNAGAIEMLVSMLAKTYRGRVGAEIQNHAVNALFNICRLSKSRQEEAARIGAIPLLQAIVRDNSPLKQFALPILCDFAHAGKACRHLLWKHDGVSFYLQLLKDTFWVNSALEALLVWLQDESVRVEACLLEQSSLDDLVRLFCKEKGTTFENLLEPLHKMLRASLTLASRLAVQSGFLKRAVERLERASKAVVRLNLLRIIKTVFDSLADRRDRDKAIQILAAPISRLAQEDKAVLSRQLAKTLAADFANTKEESKRSLAQRAMRRAASEGGGSLSAMPDTSSRRHRPALSSANYSSPATSGRDSPTPASPRISSARQAPLLPSSSASPPARRPSVRR